jgi:hypothetical protein
MRIALTLETPTGTVDVDDVSAPASHANDVKVVSIQP